MDDTVNSDQKTELSSFANDLLLISGLTAIGTVLFGLPKLYCPIFLT